MKAIIIDDEQHAHAIIKNYLALEPYPIEIIGSAFSVHEGVALIKKAAPDLIFLDIEMEDGTGFDLLNKIGTPYPNVIFITAYNHFAVQAFQFNAIDYLVKPLDHSLFKQAIDRAKNQYDFNIVHEQLELLNESLRSNKLGKRIVLRDAESIHFVDTSDIQYCSAEGSYTAFHLKDDSKIIVSRHLKEYESLLLQFQFLRIHRSYIINGLEVSRYDKAEGNLILKGGARLPISIKKEQLLKLLSST
ncbi:hypothetical protein BFP97_06965 [Roseivirga sp. 4D4]|uniref:LytR/AlgR family response regulator transcription factor n=1 Tax=Roseivirga sp. 4D4 TaxID=1889784 RepID=UPI000852DE1C|nr:LytTR family DNA-binding domain-containing protein [Roseivirga sp. 4D4]OEK01267.1 hypothetical protein BFP97_06965 [Roseivirga sp. 4D4]